MRRLAWKCKNQSIPTDSPGAQELFMATLAYKFTLSMRMLLSDINFGSPIVDPTPFFTDSEVILDGYKCERLVKSSRWMASRYAMLRYGMDRLMINPTKIAKEFNVADIVTKALTGLLFVRHRATLLGLAHRTMPPS